MVWGTDTGTCSPSPGLLVLTFVLHNMSSIFVLHKNWGNRVVQNRGRVKSCHKKISDHNGLVLTCTPAQCTPAQPGLEKVGPDDQNLGWQNGQDKDKVGPGGKTVKIKLAQVGKRSKRFLAQ